MFILSWFILLILRANDVGIPHLVSFFVGLLAILETIFYVCAILLVVTGGYFALKEKK